MNSYITFDGYKYKTVHGKWAPGKDRMIAAHRLLSGNSSVTFGPATFKKWKGTINASVSPEAGYGSDANLDASILKMQVLSFTDHYGNVHNVVVDRATEQSSLSPVWDASTNVWKVQLTLLKV